MGGAGGDDEGLTKRFSRTLVGPRLSLFPVREGGREGGGVTPEINWIKAIPIDKKRNISLHH